MSEPNPPVRSGGRVRALAFGVVAVVPLALLAWVAWLDWGYRRQAEARKELEALSGLTHFHTEPATLGAVGRCTGQGEWRDTVDASFVPRLQGLSPEGLLFDLPGIDDRQAPRLLEFPRLKRLALQKAEITSKSLATIGRLKSLESLTIQETPLEPADLAVLATLPRLKELELSQCELDDATMAVLGTLTRLERLSVRRNEFRDAGAAHLHGLQQLKHLDVSWNWITDSARSDLRRALPHCRVEAEPPQPPP